MLTQACFRQNYQVVTVYASLGEEALVHSLNEVSEVLMNALHSFMLHYCCTYFEFD
jgi:hypothetical protein